MRCPNCGNEVSDHASFCKYCGCDLSAVQAAEKPKRSSKIMLGVICAAAVCICVLAALFIFNTGFRKSADSLVRNVSESIRQINSRVLKNDHSAGEETQQTDGPVPAAQSSTSEPLPDVLDEYLINIAEKVQKNDYDSTCLVLSMDRFRQAAEEKVGRSGRPYSVYADQYGVSAAVYYVDSLNTYLVYVGELTQDQDRDGYGVWLGSEFENNKGEYVYHYYSRGEWKKDIPDGHHSVTLKYRKDQTDETRYRSDEGEVRNGLWQGDVRRVFVDKGYEYDVHFDDGKYTVLDKMDSEDGIKYIVAYTEDRSRFNYVFENEVGLLYGIAGFDG